MLTSFNTYIALLTITNAPAINLLRKVVFFLDDSNSKLYMTLLAVSKHSTLSMLREKQLIASLENTRQMMKVDIT